MNMNSISKSKSKGKGKVTIKALIIMLFIGLVISLFAGMKPIDKDSKDSKDNKDNQQTIITSNTSVSKDHIRIINGNAYKMWDGELYQDMKTGIVYDRYTVRERQ